MKKKVVRKDHHHNIPLPVLLIPGFIIIISFFLFISQLKDWAFLTMGAAIVVAVLIHREEE